MLIEEKLLHLLTSGCPITHDERVPMKEIHALFAGTGTSAAVMEAAAKTEGISPAAQQMQLNDKLLEYKAGYKEGCNHNNFCLLHMSSDMDIQTSHATQLQPY